MAAKEDDTGFRVGNSTTKNTLSPTNAYQTKLSKALEQTRQEIDKTNNARVAALKKAWENAMNCEDEQPTNVLSASTNKKSRHDFAPNHVNDIALKYNKLSMIRNMPNIPEIPTIFTEEDFIEITKKKNIKKPLSDSTSETPTPKPLALIQLQNIGELCQGIAEHTGSRIHRPSMMSFDRFNDRIIIGDGFNRVEQMWSSSFPIAVNIVSSRKKTLRISLEMDITFTQLDILTAVNECLKSLGYVDQKLPKIQDNHEYKSRYFIYNFVDENKMALNKENMQGEPTVKVMSDPANEGFKLIKFAIPIQPLLKKFTETITNQFKRIYKMLRECHNIVDEDTALNWQYILSHLYHWQKKRSVLDGLIAQVDNPFDCLNPYLIKAKVPTPDPFQIAEYGLSELSLAISTLSRCQIKLQQCKQSMMHPNKQNERTEFIFHKTHKEGPIKSVYKVSVDSLKRALRTENIKPLISPLTEEWDASSVYGKGIFDPALFLDEYNNQLIKSLSSCLTEQPDETTKYRKLLHDYIQALVKIQEIMRQHEYDYQYYVPCPGSCSVNVRVKLPKVEYLGNNRYQLTDDDEVFIYHSPHWDLIKSITKSNKEPHRQEDGASKDILSFNYPFIIPNDQGRKSRPFGQLFSLAPRWVSPHDYLYDCRKKKSKKSKK